MQAEVRRSEKLAEIEDAPKVGSRFSRETTVAELIEWWLDSVARHQVKTSTFDSYRRFAGYLADDIGGLAVVDVGAETITAWQSKLLDRYAPFTVRRCGDLAVLPGVASERGARPGVGGPRPRRRHRHDPARHVVLDIDGKLADIDQDVGRRRGSLSRTRLDRTTATASRGAADRGERMDDGWPEHRYDGEIVSPVSSRRPTAACRTASR